MTRRRLFTGLTLLGLFVLVQGAALLAYRSVERTRAQPMPFRGERLSGAEGAPLLEVEWSDGRAAVLPRGKPVLLHFWATWCPPCRDELPRLLEFGRELARGDDVEFFAISVDEDWALIEKFMSGAVPVEVVRARERTQYKRYGVSTLPDSYLVSASGKLLARYAGPQDWSSSAAREAVRWNIR